MKHTKLNLNDLQVDSFATLSRITPRRGTVRAHQETWDSPCFTNETRMEYTCGGGASDDTFCGAENTNYWQNTCGDQYTCNNYSCKMTGVNCQCNYSEGACTYGVQETCAGHNPPCPV